MSFVPARSKHVLIHAAILTITLVAVAIFGATSVQAQPDTFLNGDGHDGTPAAFGAGTYVPNAVAPVTGAVAVGASALTMGTVRAGSGTGNVGFNNGRLVMVYQTNDSSLNPTSGSQTAYPLSSSTAGHWEFARISTVAGSTLNFTAPLIYAYASGSTQVIAVPEWAALTVNNAGANINAQAWNGSSGGVVSFLVQGTVNFSAAGTVSANALGFRGGLTYNENAGGATGCLATTYDSPAAGGTYGLKGEGFAPSDFATATPATVASTQARGNSINAGGGGNCFNAGGGGGGNGGQGGVGGNSLLNYTNGNQAVGGLGGAALTYNAYDRVAMGGGGGGGERNNANNGAGGAGGGVVLVRGGTLTGNGNFRANGAAGTDGDNTSTPYDGAGGGGAGGVVLLRFVNGATCGAASTNGGVGGNNSNSGGYNWTPGGGGAGGKVYVQGSSVTCPSTATGGANGTNGGNAYGASAGGAGSTGSNASGLAAPTVTLDNPVNGSSTNDDTPTISGTATANSTVYITVDGTVVTSVSANGVGAWTYASATLTSASHTVSVRSEVAGISSANASSTFTVDTTVPAAPVITTPAPATTYTSDTTPTIAGTAEANSTVNVYRAGNVLIGTTTANGSGNWTLDTSALTEASHTITARASDAAGNQSVASASKTIVVDLTAPTVSLTAPANGSATNDTTPLVTFGLTETNQGTSRCIINGVLPGTVCTSGSSLGTLAPGTYTLTIQHTDLAGNVGTSATNTFTVDTTAPVAPSVTSPASPFTTNDQTPAFVGLGEPNNNVYIYVDGVLNSVTFTDGSGNWTTDLGTVAVGAHTVYVTTMDAAGNTSPQSAPSRSLTIDTTAPAVSITSPASDGLTVGPSGNITFTATDAIGPVTTTCQMDATPAVSCTSPFAYSSLAAGGHTFTVTATDAANNTTVAVRTFTVDATPPNTNITANPAAVTNSTNASFSFTSTESPATFECSLDGAPVSSCTSPQAYSSLGQGSHTFSVRAIDQYGNVDLTPASYTWTVDTTAPIAPTISTPGSDVVTSDTTPAIGGLSEPASTVRVYEGVTLIGTAVANGSGVWALSPDPTLTSGPHALIARATDPAGNVSANSSTRTITIDNTAPAVTISAPANGSTINTTTPAINFNVVDANQSANSTCTIDGTPVICTAGYTPAALSEGPHTVLVSHTDLAGNVGTSATYTFTVDTVAPAAPVITGGPSAPVASASAAFTFTGEPGATFECFIDSPVAWVSCTSGVNYTSLAQGAHTFYVRQTDAGGNVSSASTRSWSVDTVGPPAPSVSGPTGTVGQTSATIDFNDLESPVTYMCSLDGAPAALCTSPVNLTGLADGAHSYAVYAVDALGNPGSATTINWTVDSSLFTAGITAGPVGTVATSDNSLSFTATILSGTTFMCRVDADVFASCTSPYATGALPDGSHTFDVYAVNGSQNSATVSRTWTIDTTGPVLTINTPTNLQTVGPNGNVTFSATDGSGPITYTCQLDGGSATSCGSPYVFTGLSSGAHSVTVVATDGVGNNSVQVRNFNVDANPPQTTITANPPSATNSTGASFSFTSSEGSSTFDCSIDGAPVGPCTSPENYTGLSEGSHTFSVRATDQYGNVDQTPATYMWTVDLTAPVAPSINTPSADIVTADTTPAIAGLAEANSTVNVYEGMTLIGTATADGSGGWSLSPDPTFTEGPHALVARATDEAGNTSLDSSTRTITVDSTDPVATISSPLNGSAVNTASPDITFTATDTNLSSVVCSIDGEPAVACTSPWATSGLSEGLHNVVVVATDAAGRQATASTTFTVDLTDPVAPVIQSPGADLVTNNQTPSLSGISEPDATITIYDNGVQVDQVTANGAGDWSWTSSTTVSEAAHPYTVTASDQAGNVSDDSNTRTITVDLTAPAAPVIDSPASDGTTSSVRPPIGGTSEADALISVYDGPTLLGTTFADGSGDWTFTPGADLDEGEHEFTAIATDAADNTGPASNVRTITIDVTAPAAPEITTPATDITTTVATQAISGTAEANSTVTVYDGVVQIGSAVADGSGNWSLSPDPTFTEGPHAITARATDDAGNTSPASAIRTITFDTTPPAKPVVTAPVGASTTSDNTPTISGTAEPNSIVEVFVDGNSIGTVTANGSGQWTTTAPSLTDGIHNVTAQATDGASNTSVPADSVIFTVDTTPPPGTVTPQPGTGGGTEPPTYDIQTADGTATITCSVDGATAAPCSSPYKPSGTFAPGTHTILVTFTDPVGNVTTRTITFVIASRPVITPPPAADSDPLPAACFAKGIAISNIAVVGGKVKVSGFARLSYVGKTVTLSYKPTGVKVIANGTVGVDGSFTVSAKAPASKLRLSNKTLYRATVGDESTPWTKLARRVASSTAAYKNGKLVVNGLLSKPLMPKAPVTIAARTGCDGPWVTITKGKVNSNGAFSTSTSYKVSTGVVFVRVAAVVSKGGKKPKALRTYSFVMPVVLR